MSSASCLVTSARWLSGTLRRVCSLSTMGCSWAFQTTSMSGQLSLEKTVYNQQKQDLKNK